MNERTPTTTERMTHCDEHNIDSIEEGEEESTTMRFENVEHLSDQDIQKAGGRAGGCIGERPTE